MRNDGVNNNSPGEGFGGGGGNSMGGFGLPASQGQSGFGVPASQAQTQPQNLHGTGMNESSPLFRNEGTTASVMGGLAPITGGASTRSQATGQVSIGAVTQATNLTQMSALTTATPVTAPLPPPPALQQVQQQGLPIVAPAAGAPKGAVVRKLLDMSEIRTKDELLGHIESKTKTDVLRAAILMSLEPVVMGCIVGKSLTIKAFHSASKFFAINGDVDLLQKEIAFCGDRGEFSTPTTLLLPDNWYKWKTSKGSGDNAAFDAHFQTPENRDKFWATANTGATAHVDLDGP